MLDMNIFVRVEYMYETQLRFGTTPVGDNGGTRHKRNHGQTIVCHVYAFVRRNRRNFGTTQKTVAFVRRRGRQTQKAGTRLFERRRNRFIGCRLRRVYRVFGLLPARTYYTKLSEYVYFVFFIKSINDFFL